jgi:rhodanese-related sulfurtransferase
LKIKKIVNCVLEHIYFLVSVIILNGEESMNRLNIQINNGVPEVIVDDVFKMLGKVKLVDVRRPDEFNNELGHIQGSELVTLGSELTDYLKNYKNKEQEIIFVCRSGKRSEDATLEAKKLGLRNVANMIGGMILWNEKKFPVERN